MTELVGEERVPHAAADQAVEGEVGVVAVDHVGEPAVADRRILAVGVGDERARVGADRIADLMDLVDDAVGGILERPEQTVGLLVPLHEPHVDRPRAEGHLGVRHGDRAVGRFEFADRGDRGGRILGIPALFLDSFHFLLETEAGVEEGDVRDGRGATGAFLDVVVVSRHAITVERRDRTHRILRADIRDDRPTTAGKVRGLGFGRDEAASDRDQCPLHAAVLSGNLHPTRDHAVSMGERRRDEFLVHRLELPPSTVARRAAGTLDQEAVRRRAAANGEIHPIAGLKRQDVGDVESNPTVAGDREHRMIEITGTDGVRLLKPHRSLQINLELPIDVEGHP